ncbi:MAG: ABC-type Na+ efflux pump, permease component [Crocinitomicaceae bacterium]|jgi:sodium transport system permease protein|nr:ABC-type Na+ efflux pump, permease component [Crocinitomicaceae bacterium]
MIFSIFKKELKDTLRDRRTVIMMIVIPILVFPVIMTVFVKISTSFTEEAMTKSVNIGIVNNDKSNEFVDRFNEIPEAIGKRNLIFFKDSSELIKQINADSIQFGIAVPADYAQVSDSTKSVELKVFHNATNVGMDERAEMYLNFIEQQVKSKRYRQLNVNEQQLKPMAVDYQNVASDKETFGKLAGGFLPYLFIAFGFMGCMYPAIDLFTGEKERGTLETLLTTPVSRWHILIGKMGVVVLSGLLAASFTMLGIFLTIEVFDIIKEPRLLEIIHQILTAKFIFMFYLILIPLIVFFAGVMIPIAVYAKTFKEAQSIIAPMNAIIVLPAMVGFFPGIELNITTACIPIINVVLATKELIAGTLEFPMLALSFGIMFALAFISILFSYKRFGKETNLVS